MPVFKVSYIPRGSWEAHIEAPDAEAAEAVAEDHFDMVTRASDAGWEMEETVQVDDVEPEFFHHADEE